MTLPFFSVRVNQPFLIWSRKRPCFHFARHPRVAHGLMVAKHSNASHGPVQLDAAWTQT